MRISTILILLSYALALRADTPLSPPARYEVRSPSHKFVAVLDPQSGVRVSATNSSEVLWTSTNWFRVAYLADDGDHFITGWGGMDLIPQNYTKSLVLLTFWKRDQKIREVSVGELFPDPSVMEKTVSHYYWGRITGVTNTTLVVKTCDHRVVRFDVTTGRITK